VGSVRVVRVLPVALFQYSWASDERPTADASYIYVEDDSSSADTLDVCCGGCSWTNDLWLAGSKFEWKMNTDNFKGNARRGIGYGAPVCAFAVRGFSDGNDGCSLGPLEDYVTVNFNSRAAYSMSTLAHEVAHACNLWHVSDQGNLMNKSKAARGPNLDQWQKALVRASRHVTYF
jgi:hypothetical protein